MTKKLIIAIVEAILIIGIMVGVMLLQDIGLAEERETRPLYVTATLLNGREWPTRKAPEMCMFDYGEALQPTGRWSRDCEWIEVYGGENGTCWVYYRYVTERMAPYVITNENNGKIRIRSKPNGGGRLKGYVRHGKSIEIDQVIMGWGHCKDGWVDVEYFIEE